MSLARGALPAVFLLTILVVLGWTGSAHGQSTRLLAVEPAERTVGLGAGPFDADITVDDVTNTQGLGGYTLVVNYDPAVVRGLSIADSGFVASTGNEVACPASGVDNQIGQAAMFCFTIPVLQNPGPQTDEPRTLATVRFEPVGAGTTTLDVSPSSLTDARGGALAVTTANGSVAVRGDGPDTPAPPDDEPAEPDDGPTGPAQDDGDQETGDGDTDMAAPEASDGAADGSSLPAAGTGGETPDGTAWRISALLGVIGSVVMLSGAIGYRRSQQR